MNKSGKKTLNVLLLMFTENLFQYAFGTSSLRRCEERGEEEHDRRSQR